MPLDQLPDSVQVPVRAADAGLDESLVDIRAHAGRWTLATSSGTA